MHVVLIDIKRTKKRTVMTLQTKGNLDDESQQQSVGLPWIDLMALGWLANFTAREGVPHRLKIMRSEWKVGDPLNPDTTRYQDITATMTADKCLSVEDFQRYSELLDKYYNVGTRMVVKDNGISFLFGGL